MELINFLYYTWSFLVGAHGFVVPFPKLQTFSGIIWKLVIFVDLFICKSYDNKSTFSFLQTVQSSWNTSYL